MKQSLSKGIFILDSPATSFEDVVDEFINLIRIKNNPDATLINRIVEDLHREKRHQFQQKKSLLSSINDLRSSGNKDNPSGEFSNPYLISDLILFLICQVKVEDVNGRKGETSLRTLPPLKINSLLNDSGDNSERIMTRSQSNSVLGTITETNNEQQFSVTDANGSVLEQSGETIRSRNGELTKNAFSATNLPKLQLPKGDTLGSFKVGFLCTFNFSSF